MRAGHNRSWGKGYGYLGSWGKGIWLQHGAQSTWIPKPQAKSRGRVSVFERLQGDQSISMRCVSRMSARSMTRGAKEVAPAGNLIAAHPHSFALYLRAHAACPSTTIVLRTKSVPCWTRDPFSRKDTERRTTVPIPGLSVCQAAHVSKPFPRPVQVSLKSGDVAGEVFLVTSWPKLRTSSIRQQAAIISPEWSYVKSGGWRAGKLCSSGEWVLAPSLLYSNKSGEWS